MPIALTMEAQWDWKSSAWMEETQGMYFIMELEERQNFWMRNTIIPLDIIYVHRECRQAHSEHCQRHPAVLHRSKSSFPQVTLDQPKHVVEVLFQR